MFLFLFLSHQKKKPKFFLESTKIESKKRKFESYLTIDPDDRAHELETSQNFPVIYITPENIAKYWKGGDDISIQNLLSPVISNTLDYACEKISLVCVNQQSPTAQENILQRIVLQNITTTPIFSTFPDEKAVLVNIRSFHSTGKFFVITNKGNIFSGHLDQQSSINGTPQKIFLDYNSNIPSIGGQSVQINYTNLLQVDEYCFVPQVFADLITVILRLFEGGEDGLSHPAENQLKQCFKDICCQYNKMIETQLRQYNTLREDFKKEIETNQKEIKLLNDAIKKENHREELEDYRAEIEDYREQIEIHHKNLKDQRKDFETHYQDLEAQYIKELEEHRAEIEDYRKQIESRDKELQDHRKELEDYRDKIDREKIDREKRGKSWLSYLKF